MSVAFWQRDLASGFDWLAGTLVEIGGQSSRRGIAVNMVGVHRSSQLRSVMLTAHELAAECPAHRRRLHDAGWWAGLVCAAGVQMGRYPRVLRGDTGAGRAYCCMVVHSAGAMLAAGDRWPTVLMGLREEDLRSDDLLAFGPDDEDLRDVALRAGLVDLDLPALRALFDQGVLVWAERDAKFSRRRLVSVLDADA